VGKGKIKNKGEKMRHFKFFIFFLFLFSFLLEAVTINITAPTGSEKLKQPYSFTISWTADWTDDNKTLSEWEVYYSPSGAGSPNNPTNPGGDWQYLGSGGKNAGGGNFMKFYMEYTQC
jgi:hypothetical protein